MRKISVVGFGKIGQAVVANLLQNDIHVIAVDINPDLKKMFDDDAYVSNEPGLAEVLNPSFKSGKLKISSTFSDISGSDAVIVAIPLLVDKQKNILDQPFLDCFKNLAPHFETKC